MVEFKTNFPQESGEFKVVQLEMDGSQYLWTTASGGHPRCLTYLLEEEGGRFGIYSERESRPYKKWSSNKFEIFAKPEELEGILTYETVDDLAAPDFWDEHIPALQGVGYHVLGMGKVQINVDGKVATFFGKSMSYEIPIDSEQLSLLRNLKPDWDIQER